MSNRTPVYGMASAGPNAQTSALHVASTPDRIEFQIVDGDTFSMTRKGALKLAATLTKAASCTHEQWTNREVPMGE